MGVHKAFDSPDQLWDCFEKYKKETKKKPVLKHDFVGKNAEEVYRKLEAPLTLAGFECWLFEHNIITDLGDYMANTEGRYSEFGTICTQVKRAIRNDQIRGGMAGIYNPSITQRLNGLTDKRELDVKTEQPLFKLDDE